MFVRLEPFKNDYIEAVTDYRQYVLPLRNRTKKGEPKIKSLYQRCKSWYETPDICGGWVQGTIRAHKNTNKSDLCWDCCIRLHNCKSCTSARKHQIELIEQRKQTQANTNHSDTNLAASNDNIDTCIDDQVTSNTFCINDVPPVYANIGTTSVITEVPEEPQIQPITSSHEYKSSLDDEMENNSMCHDNQTINSEPYAWTDPDMSIDSGSLASDTAYVKQLMKLEEYDISSRAKSYYSELLNPANNGPVSFIYPPEPDANSTSLAAEALRRAGQITVIDDLGWDLTDLDAWNKPSQYQVVTFQHENCTIFMRDLFEKEKPNSTVRRLHFTKHRTVQCINIKFKRNPDIAR